MGIIITGQVFNVISDLTSQAAVDGAMVNVTNGSSVNDGNGSPYIWRASSTETADGFKIIQVTGLPTGRWYRSNNSTYGTGSANFTSTVGQTNFVVTHALSFTPNIVLPIATSAGGAAPHWIDKTLINSNTFTLVLLSVPIVGTVVKFDWIAFK